MAKIKAFLRELEGDADLLALFRTNPDAACAQEGLTAAQCEVVNSGDLNAIRAAIAAETGKPTKGLFIKVVM